MKKSLIKLVDRLLFLWMLFFFSISTSFCLEADKNQQAEITADHLTYLKQGNTAIFQGHVHIQQGSTSITADKILAYLDQHQHLKKAIAYGAPAQYQTLEDSNKQTFIATAKQLVYNKEQNHIWLLGAAKVLQGKNSISSDKIFYDIKNKSVNTFTNKKQQTEIFYVPETSK